LTGRLSRLVDDPDEGRTPALVLLGLLMGLTLILQRALDIDGVLDIDTINFGLAALRFDVSDHQPHPPGYPGYVLYLKVIHALAPGLGPVELAKWGSRLCGVATVAAAYWACSRALRSNSGAAAPGRTRPLMASLLATFHPVLWFYGADGQSHAAEALLTLLLFGGRLPSRIGRGWAGGSRS
jgi:hypothetical protein